MLPDEIGQRFPKIFAIQAHPAALILKGDSCRQRRVGGCLFNGLGLAVLTAKSDCSAILAATL